MRRFLLKVLAFFLILAAVTAGVNFAFMKMNRSDSDRTKKFSSMPDGIHICNFGSSHGMCGFNYEDVKDVPCFNFALSAQVYSYDLRMFDFYRSHIADDAVVFIPVSYFSLIGPGEEEWEGFAEKNRRYYKLFPKELIKDYDLKTAIYVNYLPSLLSPEDLITVLLGKSRDTNSESWSRTADETDVVKDADEAYKRHIVTNMKNENGSWTVNEEELGSLTALINACSAAGMKPVLVTTPFLNVYTDTVQKNEPAFLDFFHGIVDRVVRETGVPYFDYAFDSRFHDNGDLFMNSDHLNREGARRFTNILLEEAIPADSGPGQC